jgi:hypothetical protein
MWKLWLDDERRCPHEDWKVARSTDEAKALVTEFGPPAAMSLDHDLGGEDTAMVFLRWLSENYFEQLPLWRVHSANPVGKENLRAFLLSWEKAK